MDIEHIYRIFKEVLIILVGIVVYIKRDSMARKALKWQSGNFLQSKTDTTGGTSPDYASFIFGAAGITFSVFGLFKLTGIIF